MTIGVDGCKGGWVAAILDTGRISLEVFPGLDQLWQYYGSDCSLLLIDMPIGLSDHGLEGRECDRLARRLLSPRRHSSVFTPPCRAALYVPGEEASAVNFEYTGKRLSRQTINIMPKMREVDCWIRQLPEKDQERIHESHPEVIFAAMNKKIPLFHSKKTKNGQLERLNLLEKHQAGIHHILTAAQTAIPRKTALTDDLIDALALGITATKSVREPAKQCRLPDPPPRDKEGLPMEIFYFTF